MFGLGSAGSSLGNEAARVLGRSKESASRDAFPRTFKTDDFDYFGGTALNNKYTAIAEYEVPAGTEVAWGSGSADKEANQGYIYVDLQDASNGDLQGILRLSQTNPTGRNETVVQDFDLAQLAGSQTDRTQKIPLPEQVSKPLVTQDSSLVVKYKTDAGSDVEVSEDNSTVSVPITEYDLG